MYYILQVVISWRGNYPFTSRVYVDVLWSWEKGGGNWYLTPGPSLIGGGGRLDMFSNKINNVIDF